MLWVWIHLHPRRVASCRVSGVLRAPRALALLIRAEVSMHQRSAQCQLPNQLCAASVFGVSGWLIYSNGMKSCSSAETSASQSGLNKVRGGWAGRGLDSMGNSRAVLFRAIN